MKAYIAAVSAAAPTTSHETEALRCGVANGKLKILGIARAFLKAIAGAGKGAFRLDAFQYRPWLHHICFKDIDSRELKVSRST